MENGYNQQTHILITNNWWGFRGVSTVIPMLKKETYLIVWLNQIIDLKQLKSFQKGSFAIYKFFEAVAAQPFLYANNQHIIK
ncbi:hypothetical protein SanaruYs_03440 [Chryseotalea sanaruensis]|uniref:Uncharacterized protein n=1 Tax=Chryseotalea sanaruensis TaxID=2482724 RepID=A0A401U5H9_9BACT|nr:hypothetical protein SanaruYs_03440 [Chryseotalea sanaruensis]